MKNKKLGFALMPVIVIVLVAIGIGGYLWVKQAQPISPSPEDGMIACTMDAKRCPDGSYVGRTGPNCEFEACPSVSPVVSKTVLNEKMISNMPYFVEPEYPTRFVDGIATVNFAGKSNVQEGGLCV